MTGPLLALAVAAAPLWQAEWEPPPAWEEEQEEGDRKRLFVSAWGGEAFDAGGAGESYGVVGAEAAWAFAHLDVGVAGYGYRGLAGDEETWTRVGMVRLTQRFEMRTGVEAAFSLGLGAARIRGAWDEWFQVALGVRVPLGPLFLGGELAFERGDLLRLTGGLGVAL